MPRYFFHVSHHASDPDTEGTELPDIHAAQAAAMPPPMIRTSVSQAWESGASALMGRIGSSVRRFGRSSPLERLRSWE